MKHQVLQGGDQWRQVSAALRHVVKYGDIKLYECPKSAITSRTRERLRLVNRTTDSDGNILHLPFPGLITEQPGWYLEAVEMVKSERAAWQREQMKKGRR